jgi:Holliday junction DNA helicase RuvA
MFSLDFAIAAKLYASSPDLRSVSKGRPPGSLFVRLARGMLRAMIGRLQGKIADKSAEGAVVDVSGVGYDVALPLSTLAALPPVGERISLWIHTHVREDELKLFGFADKQDRTAFRTMLKVGGVGPKVALAVIGGLSGDQLARVVEAGDTKRLTAIPGIGKKTAERVILELGGKLDLGRGAAGDGGSAPFAELDSALRNLGFKPAQIERAIAEIGKSEESSSQPFEVLLRQGLALLQRSG